MAKNDEDSTNSEKTARPKPGSEILLLQVHLPEQVFAEGIDFIARDLFTDWLKNRRVGNHYRWHLIVHHLLRLLVQRHAFFAIGYRFCFGNQVIKRSK